MRTTKALLALFALTVMPLTACSDDDDDDDKPLSINPSYVTFHFEETQQLTASDNTAVTWATDDDFVATVDADGLLTAAHVGTTLAKATDSKNRTVSIPVTVLPTYVTYAEPYLNWGASASDVKSNVSLTLDGEKDDLLTYTNEKFIFGYVFSENKLIGVNVFVPTSVNAEEITVFLFERYKYLSQTNGKYYFLTQDENTAVCLTVYSANYYLVTYADVSSSSSKSLALDNVESLAAALAL